MKAINLTIVTLFIFLLGFSQEETIKNDTTKIKIGKSEIIIINKDAKNLEIIADESEDTDENGDNKTSKKFRGHWGSIDIGLNNYITSDYSLNLPSEYNFLDLHTGKSWAVGLNLIEKNITLKKNMGIITGLGFEFNNYRFNNDYILMNDSADLYAVESAVEFRKSKLTASYLTVPLIFEVQFPANQKRRKRMHIAIGPVGALKIGSHTKYVTEMSNNGHINKEREDFHLNPFRYGISFRMGYSGINIFANYYMSTLFEKGAGPELYPVSAGISFCIF
ncbi:MAG: hypothetical protein Kow0068_17230 [Marinilabiliales bacterium]